MTVQPSAAVLPVSLTLALVLAACQQAPAPVVAPTAADPDPTLRARFAFTVTNTNDDGPGSLRRALANAALSAGPDTVTVAADGTVPLASTLVLDSDVTVQGPGASRFRLSGRDAGRAVLVARGAHVTLNDLTVTNGNVSGRPAGASLLDNVGGGVFVSDAAELTLNRAVVTASAAFGAGGVYVHGGGALTLRDSAVTGNRAESTAAGLVNAGTTVMTNSSVADNTGGPAGGIWNTGTFTMTDGLLSGNRAAYAGGLRNQGVFVMSNSTVRNNAAGSVGGVEHQGESFTVTNSTVSGNRAPGAAGVFVYSTGFVMRHATVAGNSTAGLSVDWATNAAPRIEASVFEDNGTADTEGPVVSLGHNVVGKNAGFGWDRRDGWLDLFGSVDGPVAAHLGPLRNNGGRTLTHALLPGSPAIDFAPGRTDADQRGVPVVNGVRDAGSYEYRNTAPGAPVLASPATPTNAESVALTWTAADPEGQPLAFTLWRRGSGGSFAPLAAGLSATTYSWRAPEGTADFRVRANDGELDGPDSNTVSVKVDRTAPAAPGANVTGTLVNGWYRDGATVTFAPGADPALPDGSAGSGTVFTTASQVFTTTGTFSASGVSRDAANNTSAATTVNVAVDAGRPSLGFTNCAPQVTIGSAAGLYWTASDTGSGLDTPAGGSVPLDTSTVGPKSVSVTARDKVGHETSATCAPTVVYPFGGFVGLQAAPNVNAAPYPYTIVTFSLGGDYGKDIYAPGFPAHRPVDCTTKAALSGWTPAYTATAGTATQYDAMTRRYQFAWAMTSMWTGCRELDLRTNDGVDHSVYYRR